MRERHSCAAAGQAHGGPASPVVNVFSGRVIYYTYLFNNTVFHVYRCRIFKRRSRAGPPFPPTRRTDQQAIPGEPVRCAFASVHAAECDWSCGGRNRRGDCTFLPRAATNRPEARIWPSVVQARGAFSILAIMTGPKLKYRKLRHRQLRQLQSRAQDRVQDPARDRRATRGMP